MNAPELFRLGEQDRRSPVWLALHDYYVARLAMLRAQNDSHADAEKTAFKRGQIAEAKALLALANEPFQMPDE